MSDPDVFSDPRPDVELQVRTVERTSVADAVHDQLLAAILRGDVAVDAMLPGEVELAAQAKVNRQAVREALQRLRQVGVVEIVHGGGVRVLDWRVHGTLSLLASATVRADGSVDPAVAGSVFRLRMVTLVDASRMAAELRPDGLVDELRRHLVGVADTGDAVGRRAAAEGVWGAVAVASGNVAYRLVHNTQSRIVAGLPAATLATIAAAESEPLDGLVDAIAAGDGDLAAQIAGRVLEPAVSAFAALDGAQP